MAKFNCDVKRGDLLQIDINDIYADESTNGRWQPAPIDDLQASFLERIERGEHPQLTPVVVKPLKDRNGFTLIAGFRRVRALYWLNMEHFGDNPDRRVRVKAVITDSANDGDAFLANLTENVERHDLSPMDKSFAVTRLGNVFSKTDAEIAKIMRWNSVSSVSQYRSLWQLADEVKAKVHSGEISFSAALLLVNDPESAAEVAAAIASDNRTVPLAEVREKVRQRRDNTMENRVSAAIERGDVPPRGDEQSDADYRAEVRRELEERDKQRKLRRTPSEVRRFFEDMGSEHKGAFAVASAIVRYWDGDLSADQLYRAMRENCLQRMKAAA